MTTPREIAEKIAADIRAAGLTVSVEHSINDFGASSYIFANATDGKRYARFGARISDHAVGSNRWDRDLDRVQHYAQIDSDMDAFAAKLMDVAAQAKAHIGL